MSAGTRISIRIRDPNPCFRQWITEWANSAENNGKENLAKSLRRALVSLEKYPLPLKSGRECMILEGFGVQICDMLDKKLSKHKTNVVNPPPVAIPSPVKSPLKKRITKPVPTTLSMSQGVQPGPSLVADTEAKSNRIRKTKSEQNLPKDPQKTALKRKAITPIEEEVNSSPIPAPISIASADISKDRIIMLPGTFQVLLLVDSMETVGKKKSHMDQTLLELDRNKTPYEVRRLNIGDFTWIARDSGGNELVLPYVVERKRLDDLAGSIKSGRYQEQKFRLRNSGIPNVTYLIEYLDVKNYGLPIQTLYKAVVNSEVHSDCQIKYTDSPKDTMLYLSVHTALLAELFAQKRLCSCAKEDLPPFSAGGGGSDTVSLMSFLEFNQGASKYGLVQIKDFFVRQLIQLHQMSVEKALAIVAVYATPRTLLNAYENPRLTDVERRALLSKITYGAAKRTIGASLSKIMFDFYHTDSPS